MKTCCRCKLDFDLSEFRKDPSKKDGKASYCKTCLKETQRLWYNKNKAQAQATARQSYEKRKTQVSERKKELRQLNPEKYRAEGRRRYCPIKNRVSSWKQAGIIGMTYERYQQLLHKQNHCCAICGRHESYFKKALSVDHEHKTGKPRGLLCDNCNRALGYVKESETIINNLLNYVICHK